LPELFDSAFDLLDPLFLVICRVSVALSLTGRFAHRSRQFRDSAIGPV
jgi:hypothetical protein